MTIAVFCGDALCKRPVTLPGGQPAFPIRCGACGAALYPADVLARLPPSEIEPNRRELMVERGGVRVPIDAAGLGTRPVPEKPRPAGEDPLLDLVNLGPATPATPKRTGLWIAVALVVLALIVVAVAVR